MPVFASVPVRAAQAMGSMTDRLIRAGLALLFAPPFDRAPADPGYIKGYPPGLRENGGQYSLAAMWAILAQARLGNGAAAADLFALLNPINHALSADDVQRYKVEPYVIAADVYSAPPARRARRVDLVHRLCRLDAARQDRGDHRPDPAGQGPAL